MIRRVVSYLIISVAIIVANACGTKHIESMATATSAESYHSRYATMFQILSMPDSSATLLILDRATPQSVDSILITQNTQNRPSEFGGLLLRGEAQRVITLDDSLIADLDSLGVAERIVGVASMAQITNTIVRERFRRGQLLAIGDAPSLDFDAIVALRPDIIFLDASANGDIAVKRRLDALGIPYLYIDNSGERSQLAQQEWIVALAQIVGRDEVARRYFASTKARRDTLMKRTIEILHLEDLFSFGE